MEIGFQVDNVALDSIQKLFKTLPKRLQGNAMRSAFRDAAKPLKTAIKSNIPTFDLKREKNDVNDKILRKSIGTVIRRGKKDRQLYAMVGPILEKGGWFGHWLEFGTLAKRSEPLKGSRSAKAQSAADKGLGLNKAAFMRTATKNAGPSVIKVLRFRMVSEINNQVNKTLKRGKL